MFSSLRHVNLFLLTVLVVQMETTFKMQRLVPWSEGGKPFQLGVLHLLKHNFNAIVLKLMLNK